MGRQSETSFQPLQDNSMTKEMFSRNRTAVDIEHLIPNYSRQWCRAGASIVSSKDSSVFRLETHETIEMMKPRDEIWVLLDVIRWKTHCQRESCRPVCRDYLLRHDVGRRLSPENERDMSFTNAAFVVLSILTIVQGHTTREIRAHT